MVEGAMMQRWMLPLLVACVLPACTRWLGVPPCTPILPPQPVVGWPVAKDWAELVRLQPQGGDERRLVAVVSRDPERLQLRGLSPLGLDWFRLEYEAGEPVVEWIGGPPADFDARVLVGDFQLVHWPVERLQAQLPRGRWSLTERNGLRTLSCGNQLVATVEYLADGGWRLFNPGLGYTLVGQPLGATGTKPPSGP